MFNIIIFHFLFSKIHLDQEKIIVSHKKLLKNWGCVMQYLAEMGPEGHFIGHWKWDRNHTQNALSLSIVSSVSLCIN